MHPGLQIFAYSLSSKQLKAAVPSCRQTGSARNNTPGSSLPQTHGKILWHSLSARVSSVELISRCPQRGLPAHLLWLLSPFLTFLFPYRCFLHLSKKLQLTLEQCRFELHGTTYLQFFIYLCSSNPYPRFTWHWESSYVEGQLQLHVDFLQHRWSPSLTPRIVQGSAVLAPSSLTQVCSYRNLSQENSSLKLIFVPKLPSPSKLGTECGLKNHTTTSRHRFVI